MQPEGPRWTDTDHPTLRLLQPPIRMLAAGVPGVALADAFDVEAIIRSSLAKKPPRFFKRMTAVQHLFFDLPQILCPPTAGAGRDIASPRESRDAFAEATQGRGQRGSPSAENRLIPEPGPVQAEQLDALRRRDVQRIRRDFRTPRPRLIVAMGEI